MSVTKYVAGPDIKHRSVSNGIVSMWVQQYDIAPTWKQYYYDVGYSTGHILSVNCLSIGTTKTINFPFVPNGKSLVLGVPVFKYIRVYYSQKTKKKKKMPNMCSAIVHC